MRQYTIAALAPLALLVGTAAHAAPDTTALKPICTADLSPRCQALAEVPASATIAGPELAARISVANCMAMEKMAKLELQPNRGSINELDHAAEPSLAMLDDVIAHGDPQYRTIATAARADLLNGMVVRIRIVANDPKDKHDLETRLALWTDSASKTIALGPSCPRQDVAL